MLSGRCARRRLSPLVERFFFEAGLSLMRPLLSENPEGDRGPGRQDAGFSGATLGPRGRFYATATPLILNFTPAPRPSGVTNALVRPESSASKDPRPEN